MPKDFETPTGPAFCPIENYGKEVINDGVQCDESTVTNGSTTYALALMTLSKKRISVVQNVLLGRTLPKVKRHCKPSYKKWK